MKLPALKVPQFENNEADPLAFQKFSVTFESATACYPNLNNEQKLIFLRTLLKGNALSLIANQTEFDVAWNVLNTQYFQVDSIIDCLLAPLIDPAPLTSLKSVSEYFTVLRFKIQELSSLGVDCVTGALGCRLLSKTIRAKLPGYILQEVSRRTGSNYASVENILAHIEDILAMYTAKQTQKTQQSTSVEKTTQGKTGSYSKGAQNNQEARKNFSYAGAIKKTPPSAPPVTVALTQKPLTVVQKAQTEGEVKTKLCRFCNSENHSSSSCTKYVTIEARKARADELKRCSVCLSEGHQGARCKNHPFPFKCVGCGETSHIQPFCPSSKQ
jgi:hypothetical protein